MVLETERLHLRNFVEADWTAILAYQNTPLSLRYHEWVERTPHDVREFVQMFLRQQQEEPRTKFQFVVVLKSEEQRFTQTDRVMPPSTRMFCPVM